MNPKAKSNDTENLMGKLRKTLYGVQPGKNFDKVDMALARISTDALNNNTRTYAEMMQRAFNAALHTDDLNNATAELMTDIGTTARLGRYISAEEVVDGISYCARALKVLKDGIISPDDVTKESLQILQSGKPLDGNDSVAKDIRSIIKVLKIDKMMNGVVYETLKLGDQFVEICDYNSEEVPITQSMLNESGKSVPEPNKSHSVKLLEAPGSEEGTEFNLKLELSYDDGDVIKVDDLIKEGPNDTVKQKEESTDEVELKNVRILTHDPRTVIKLQSKRYRMCLGYLVLPTNEGNGPAPGMGSGAPGAGGYGGSVSSGLSGLNSLLPSASMVTGIDSLYMDLIKKVKKHFESNEKTDIQIDKSEVKELIARAVREIEADEGTGITSHTAKLKLRYVPVNRMEHFLLSSQRFFPYGESIFFKSILQCKFLIALEASMTMKRISDSTDRRIWYVEHGIPRDARNLIEELKQANKKKKFSVDTLGTISTIASQLTFNEDIYIPQSKGKRFVEPDVLSSHVDIRSVVEDLKYLRDEIVAGLEVPPAYLNLEENLSACVNTSYIELTNGKTILLKDMIEQFEKGKEFEVISYDEDKGVLFPNKVKWVGYTQHNVKAVKVTFDNDKSLTITPEHKIMLRSGKYVEAGDLKPDDSIMPFYKDLKLYGKKRTSKYGTNNYFKIYHPGINVWDWMHTSFSKYKNIVIDGEHCHHIDMNPTNNESKNLIGLSPEQHMALHGRTRLFSRDELTQLQNDRNKLFELAKPGLTYDKRKCIICNSEFEVLKVTDQVTCSPACKSAYHRQTGLKSWDARKGPLRKKYPHIIRDCDWCGNDFELVQTAKYLTEQVDKPYKWYHCSDPHCSKKVRGANISMSKMKGILSQEIYYIDCDICGKLCVQCSTDNSKQFKTVCRNITCINTKLSRDSATQRQNRYTIECPICGKEVEKPGYYKTKYPSTCGDSKCYAENISRIGTGYYSEDIDEFEDVEVLEEATLNHKVVKIEWLEEKIDCGDIEVEHYHNFAVDAGIIIHNSNKNALTFENMIFAQTITSYQDVLSDCLQGLIDKIYLFTKKQRIKEGIDVVFPPPKMLQLEKDAEKFDMISRIVQAHRDMGIDDEWAKKRHLNIPWEDVERTRTSSELEKKMNPPVEDDGMGGMGGQGGMGGGGGF